MQKTLEQQLAEAQAKRQQIDARLKKLGERQKANDLRRRAKGEKVLLQVMLALAGQQAEFRQQLLDEVAATTLKPEDQDAAFWLLQAATGEIAAKAPGEPQDAVAASEQPEEQAAYKNARAVKKTGTALCGRKLGGASPQTPGYLSKHDGDCRETTTGASLVLRYSRGRR